MAKLSLTGAQASAELEGLERADAEQQLLDKLDHQLAADVEKFISEKKQKAAAQAIRTVVD
jgi:ribosomal protein S12 methylthiotransferase accessory factor YcaO